MCPGDKWIRYFLRTSFVVSICVICKLSYHKDIYDMIMGYGVHS